MAATLAHHADRENALPAESRRHALFLRASAFVRERAGEPDLSPAAIAAAHGISPRYLHRVFQQHGTTVSGYVKRLRLDRCRRDLADPGLGHLPVHAVGARWGFPRAAEFSRAFRADTGMPPGEYRSLVQRSAVVPAGDRERTDP
ncbi:helix-turn-helix domain-containing protein [Streptomyces sp. ME19-01-6]|uniref:helix-turn-helix domain-containing protein n=1 Tax=Streptomyces sp. ME19-01-6 TaxID=3028686 RepID=UPI0029B69BD6|nr:helix-turn-helix domain-containing protein [Streptomyces sp. ME19-01-6]MDX3229193.1 helix-turn-helix domain-containing protein [Streptomyces sp. ME19-01-6]